MIVVERTGPLALVQDLGRPGYAHLGVPPSGAADRAGLQAANRLVGNPESYAGIESTLGGLVVRALTPVWCAVTGPAGAVSVDGRPDGSHHPVHLLPGQRLSVEVTPSGLRRYLAVRGGIAVTAVLGSRSTDVLSGLGPAPLRPGDRLPLGRSPLPLPVVDVAPPPVPPVAGAPMVLRISAGPRSDWFTAAARQALVERTWTVAADSDRTAVRLQGVPLTRRIPGELPSEGMIRGAIQVPPSGQPLVLGADHPVTGGYPVIAVVSALDCDRAAQLRPGDPVRLRRACADRYP